MCPVLHRLGRELEWWESPVRDALSGIHRSNGVSAVKSAVMQREDFVFRWSPCRDGRRQGA